MSKKELCNIDDLIANSGVCVMHEQQQIALFYLPDTKQKVFALGNWDPIGNANVLSRGMIGNIGEHLVVASPLYKQHFSLITGHCLEEDVCVPTYRIEIQNESVVLLSQ